MRQKSAWGSWSDWRPLLEFVAISIALPVAIYWLIRHHLSVETDGEAFLAGVLGVAGFVLFVILRMR